MVKNTKKAFIKLHRKKKYIKDKAIINFILQHERKVSIDFSKIKIPPFFKCLKNYNAINAPKIPPKNVDFNSIEQVTNQNSVALGDKIDLQSISSLSTEL